MTVSSLITNALAEAVRAGGASPTLLSLLVEAEEAGAGVVKASAEALFTRPDGAIADVAPQTECERVARTAAARWDVPGERIDQPASLQGLVNLLAHARDTGRRLRLVGSARSLSNVSQPAADGRLVATCRYGAALDVDAGTLRDGVEPKGLYRAEAGRVLGDVLNDLDASGRTLGDMGSGCFQTLAGVLSTASHGSGVTHPAFPGAVRSMDVVTYDARGAVIVQRVEPTAGVTDPARFAAWSATQPIPMALVQDDAVFHAWTVSLGCLGAIYSITVAAEPTYWLRETRTLAWWSEVKDAMGADLNGIEYYELLVSTWPTDNAGKQDRRCLVTKRVRVTDPAEQRVTNGRPLAMRLAQTPVGHVASEVTALWAMRDPLVRVAMPQKTGVTASEVPADRPYTDKNFEVLLLRMDINASSSELGIPLSVGVDGRVDPANAIAATDTILALADENQALMKKRLPNPRPFHDDFEALLAAWREAPLHLSPIAVRFVAPEQAFLAMQYGAPTCMIEMPMPGSDAYDRALVDPPALGGKTYELYRAYDDGRKKLFRDVEERLRATFRARPHWGQVNSLTWATTTEVFPAAPRWKAVYDVNNALGVFDGPVTDQLGIGRGAAGRGAGGA